ncbi:MAG: hypothetical protein J7549_10475 [Variovorax sp.]|nr:hypothetical protein [Variovorax sp.]
MNVSLACRLLLVALFVPVAALLVQQPFVTNDGPVHVAFSDLLAHWQQPGRELQREAYDVGIRLDPNLLTYLLMAPLLKLGSAHLAESVVQALCLVGPVAAGWLALRTVNRDNAWLAIFLFPLSLNEMFFLGLYNYCLSTAMFFLAVAAAWHLQKAPSLPRAVLLGAALCATLLTHAAGFVAAFLGLGAMGAARVALPALRGEGFVAALLRQRHFLLGLAIPLPLLMAASSDGGDHAIEYGPGPGVRFMIFALLLVLRMASRKEMLYSAAVAGVLFALCAWAVMRHLRDRDAAPKAERDAFLATLAALGMALATTFAFPDTFGGGWTHFRRFVLFPFYWILVLAALRPVPSRGRLPLFALGGLLAVVSVSFAGQRETTVRRQLPPLAAVDPLIGRHCTVLPLVVQTRPVGPGGHELWLSYAPYFQVASRLESRGDRVVLFNFLARLTNYPVRFKPHVEPQSLIFGWKPEQEEVAIERLDIPRFERTSGLHVDYVLLIGQPASAPPRLQRQIHDVASTAQRVYESPGRSLTLYRRGPGAGSRCTP